MIVLEHLLLSATRSVASGEGTRNVRSMVAGPRRRRGRQHSAFFAIAAVGWIHGNRASGGRPGVAIRIGVIASGMLMCYFAAFVRFHPDLIFDLSSPFPWQLVGGPCLLLSGLSRSSRRGERVRRRSPIVRSDE